MITTAEAITLRYDKETKILLISHTDSAFRVSPDKTNKGFPDSSFVISTSLKPYASL